MANEILTEIRLELDKFRADLKEAASAAEKAGRKSGNEFGGNLETGMLGAFTGIKAQLLALGAAVGGFISFKESIKAASEQETAIQKLNSALAISGNYTAAGSAHFQEFASSLQKTTTAADDMIERGGAVLASLGKLSGEGLERATMASLNFAAATGTDVESAFNVMAKAAQGNVIGLSRYGIKIRETGDAAADFGVALKELEKRFGGLAQAQSNTFEGAFTKMKNQFGEVLESIGNIAIKSPATLAVVKLLADTFESAAAKVAEFAKGRDIMKEIAVGALNLGHILATYVLAPIEFTYNLTKTLGLAFATAFAAIGAAAEKGYTLIHDVFIKPVVDFIGNVLGGLIGIVDEKTGAVIKNLVSSTTTAIGESTGAAGTYLADLTGKLGKATGEASGKLFDFDVTLAADTFMVKAEEFLARVKPGLETNFKNLSDGIPKLDPGFLELFAAAFVRATTTMKKAAEELGTKMRATLEQGLSNSFAAMGAALVKGENAFAAFGKAMLGVLGDIAIQSGAAFIALGIARAIASYGLDPSAPALIAAGAGLSILGGALKAISGAGGAAVPSTGGSGGGGIASGGGTGTAPTYDAGQNFSETSRGEVGTKVEVNVAGNILDRRETGLAIADIINDAFGSQGVTYATAGSQA